MFRYTKKHRPAAANKIKASAYVAAVDYVNPKSEQFVLSISRLDSVRYESRVCYSVGTYI